MVTQDKNNSYSSRSGIIPFIGELLIFGFETTKITGLGLTRASVTPIPYCFRGILVTQIISPVPDITLLVVVNLGFVSKQIYHTIGVV